MSSAEFDSREHVERNVTPLEKKFRVVVVLLVVFAVVAASEGFYSWSLTNRVQALEGAMQEQISSQDESIQRVQDQLGMHEKNFADMQDDLSKAQTALNSTQGELKKTREATDLLAKQQKDSSEQLNGQLGQLQQDQETTKGTVGMLTADVSGVKQDVGATREDLAATKSELQRTIGDLGVQSGLVARNRQELDELKLRGERIYFEFDLRKAGQPQKYKEANVALQLKKTDLKRQKYTLNLLSDDRIIEKKDKNTNEPVQFYQQGYRIPSEIVVNKIYKDRIVGYISVPKAKTETQTSAIEKPESGERNGT